MRVVNWRALIVRGICGGVAVWLFFLAIRRIGLAQGTVLSFTYPVFAAAVAPIWLKERCGLGVWAAIAVALVGVYLVVWPEKWDGSLTLKLLALLGGALGGIAVAAIRKLRETHSSYVILLSQCVFGLLIVAVPANATGYQFSMVSWVLLLGIGVFATVGQLLMTYAFKLVRAAEGSLIGMLTPVLNVAWGALFFKEAMPPRAWAGAAVVLASCAYVSVTAGRRTAVAEL